MKYIIKLVLLFLLSSSSMAMQNVFYVLHGHKATQQILPVLDKHVKAIDIIISQAYHIDKNGIVTGNIDPELINFANVHKIKLMAMITNSGFDAHIVHQFLSNKNAQEKAVHSILALCKQNHLYGVQFDFEMVSVNDRNALTRFYQRAADVLHQNGFVVSFAVAPVVNNATTLSSYHQQMYRVWGGAYDLEALGKSADFITVMTYDQHIGLVTPGPNAGIRWVEDVIKHTLKFVPAYKISLGVPSYSRIWYTGKGSDGKIRMLSNSISYQDVQKILKQHNARLQWDAAQKVHFATFEHNWLNQYMYVEDARSLKAKLELVRKFHLRGISFFRIGTEDPEMWQWLS